MGVLPKKTIDLIQFCETHNTVWESAPPTAIGLTAAMVLSLKNLTETARGSYSSAETVRSASRAATQTLNNDAELLRTGAADLIRQIKAFAELQANPTDIYSAAEIPEPQPPQPLGPPGQPGEFTVGLEPTGAITLRWKAANATPSTGTFFTVSRKLFGQSMFTVIGTVGMKQFTDSTLMQGTAGATYQVQPVRGDVFGTASVPVGVQFGVGSGGGGGGGMGGLVLTNATMEPEPMTPVKMAA